jgi:peptidoglycan/LPS O-acetylase OafA/YrhL
LLDPLTSIRFFAAFHVVVYHNADYIVGSLPPGPVPDLVRNACAMGYGGVNLFFVLSGFILAYTYLEPGRTPRVALRRFWVARLARIYPVYVLSLVLVVPPVLAHFYATNPPLLAIAKAGVSGLSALTLTHAWIPPFRGIWNSPSWSLSAEAFFYLLFPFLAGWAWRLRPRGAMVLALACWVASTVPMAIGLVLLPGDVAWVPATDSLPSSHLAVFLRIAPIFRLNEFVFGIALARAFFPRPREERDVGAPAWATPLAVVAMVGIGTGYFLGDHIPRLLIHGGFLDPLYGMLVVGLAHCGGWLKRILSVSWLLVLGEASYSVYVLHIPIRGWLLDAVGESEANELGLVFFAAYAAIVLLTSIVAFRWIESPMRRWIRSRFSGARPPARLEGSS